MLALRLVLELVIASRVIRLHVSASVAVLQALFARLLFSLYTNQTCVVEWCLFEPYLRP